MDDDAGRPSLLDVVCYAPLGLVHVASEELPKLARQRRQAVENHIVLARWIGQIAVQQAEREIRKRWAASRPPAPAGTATPASPEPAVAPTGTTGSRDEVVPADASPDAPPVVEEAAGSSAAAEETSAPDAAAPAAADKAVPAADELPIAGYESLAAQQVVHRLPTLTVAERDAIRRFETAHRHRRTILAKLDQLQAG